MVREIRQCLPIAVPTDAAPHDGLKRHTSLRCAMRDPLFVDTELVTMCASPTQLHIVARLATYSPRAPVLVLTNSARMAAGVRRCLND